MTEIFTNKNLRKSIQEKAGRESRKIKESFQNFDLEFQKELDLLLDEIERAFPEEVYSLELLFEKFSGFLKSDMGEAASGLTLSLKQRQNLRVRKLPAGK